MQKILVVDDDKDMCILLERFLAKHGFEVIVCFNGKRALEVLDEHNISLVLTDFRLEDMDGKTLLTKIKTTQPDLPIIIITGYSDVKIAVEVIKSGAFDYVTKPLFPDEILVKIKEALSTNQHATIQEENVESHVVVARTKEKPYITHGQYIFGDGPAFKKILNQILLVAPTNYSIIIYGETGTGKEVIANEIHNHSKRKDKPFIAIDCGALSKELAGSELFGHERGAFTGALMQKIGSFELANGGTIFLDEVANLSYDIQISLLRVVQERKMRRVGGTKDIDLDVRIIVASNERLWSSEKKGKFREDLFHRFNEFSIEVPPLRERREDILLFANHFLHQTNIELGKNIKRFSNEVESIFRSYVWYGNLRELRNVIKRATLLSDGEEIEASSLPFEISHFNKLQFDKQPEPVYSSVASVPNSFTEVTENSRTLSESTLKGASIDAEYEMILKALKKVN